MHEKARMCIDIYTNIYMNYTHKHKRSVPVASQISGADEGRAPEQ